MCRHAAYVGHHPITLEALLIEPPHSLVHQSWEPREQRSGVVNADGFGVGWYDRQRRPEPARYRSARPVWGDQSFHSMAGLVASTAILAVVRSATPRTPTDPAPADEASTPPFTAGPWLFSHNGAVEGFWDGVGTRLRRSVSERRDRHIRGASDSEVLFAMVLDRVDAGQAPLAAVRDVVAAVRDITTGSLNFLMVDGERIIATAAGDSLWARSTGGSIKSAIVASEPFDDEPGWYSIPEETAVEAVPGDVRCEPL